MEECLQYAAADGGGLVGGSKAVGLLAPWVDVAAFHALVDLQAALEQAPETAGEGRMGLPFTVAAISPS